MFEQELFNYIKNNFTVSGFSLGFGFGEIKENQAAPYIIMFPLTDDGTRQVLCNVDDYTDGETSIQFNVYAKNYKNACVIRKALDTFLANIKVLTSYNIVLNNHEVSRGFENINTGLSVDTVTRLFTYQKRSITNGRN